MGDLASHGRILTFGGYKIANQNLATLTLLIYSLKDFTYDELIEEYESRVGEDKSIGMYGIKAYLKQRCEFGDLDFCNGRYYVANY